MSNMETYKELAKEMNDLRNDLTRQAHAAKFAVGANKSAIAERKRKYEALEDRVRELEKMLPTVLHRIKEVEDTKREHTGKIRTMELEEAKDDKGVALAKNRTENTKNKLALYGSIALALITGIVNLVLHFVG